VRLPDSRTAFYDHQAAELEEHGMEEARGLLWTMRVGKSKTAIDRSSLLWQWGKIRGALVFAPTGVHRQWAEEQVPAHCGVPNFAHAWDTSGREEPSHRAAMVMLEAQGGGRSRMFQARSLPFLCVNTEAMHWPAVKKAVRDYVKALHGQVHVIADESHMFRTPGAVRTAFLRTVAKRCAYRTILTGTPVGNSVRGLYSQFEVLRRGALGHFTFEDYKDEFLIRRPFGPPGRRKLVEVGQQNLGKLSDLCRQFASVIRREDCPDLPPLIRARRLFEPHPSALRELRRLEGNVDIEVAPGAPGELPSGPLALLAAKCRAASGWGADWEPLYPPEECPRLAALRDTLLEADGRAVVWCRYRQDVQRVVEDLCAAEDRYGIGQWAAYGHHGGYDTYVREEQRGRWAGTPRAVLVATPETAGVGIDLSAASDIVWYSHTWDAVTRAQADERCTALGGAAVGVTDLCGAGTEDVRILDAHDRKADVAEEVKAGMLA